MGLAYRRDVDGLRAVAMLLVVVFHFQLIPFGKSGFIGVDIFFVISGFLITRIILRDLETGRFRLGAFYYRRIRRLYPALLVTLSLYLLAGWVIFLPDLFRELGTETLLSLGYVVNFHYWQTVNYFGIHAERVPLLHLWSLAIEEQFYLLFPLTVMLLFRFWPRALLAVLVITALASFVLGTFAAGWKPEAAFYLLPTRAWELLVGAILAVAVGRTMPRGLATVIGALGVFAILAALVVHSPDTKTPGVFTLLPVLGAAALIASGQNQVAFTTRSLSVAPLVWVGRISYPLYLVHWPILILQKEMLETYGYGHRITGLVASVLLAWAIYRFVERPIRNGALRPARLRTAFAGSTLAVAALSVGAVVSQGAPQRFADDAMRVYAVRADSPRDLRICNVAHGDAPPCRLGDKTATPRFLLIGDSHAAHLAPALDHWLREVGGAGRLAFGHACLPVANIGPHRCKEYMDDVLNWALASNGPESVLFESIWVQALEEGEFSRQLEQTVSRLVDAGKTVVLVEPFFVAPNPVPETIAKNMVFGRDWPVETSLAEYHETFGPILSAFDGAEAAGAKRISLIADFCGDGTCRPFHDGQPILVDTNHLTAAIAPVIAQILGRELTRLGLDPN